MDLLKEFQRYIKEQDLFQPKDKLLLAVSGGVDSVVLCDLCKQAGYDFTILHCNFQLRGEESERDERFVKELAENYKVEVLTKRFDTLNYASEMKLGIQEAARDLRYYWFMKICAEKMFGAEFNEPNDRPGWHTTIYPGKPNCYLLTAHHVNDSIETMLMNFFKGTGIRGLKGILPKHEQLPFITRPLLFATRNDIEQYAKQHNLSWVEDSSNSSGKYTRNYFRNELIPQIKKVFPGVENNLADNLARFNEIDLLYQQSIQLHKKKLLEQKGSEIHIPVLKLLKAVPLHTIVYEIIKDHGFTANQTGDVVNLLKSETGKYIRSSTHRAIKNRNWLIISPNDAMDAQNILIEEEGELLFGEGKLQVKKILSQSPAGNPKPSILNDQLIAQLDGDEINFPLLLRKWKQGDYFYPLGMKKKKKLSRFFIDQKLSLTQKERTWVIEADKKIAWVVGLRIDDRFKITDKTKNILQIGLSVSE